MRVAVFSTKSYDKEHFHQANGQYGFDLEFFDVRLEAKTARLAHGFPVVCLFVNDDADREVLTELAQYGTRVIALRCAGYNNVDLAAAKELGLKVVRVPAYSPRPLPNMRWA
jgi:D-lactate dehydrogenase